MNDYESLNNQIPDYITNLMSNFKQENVLPCRVRVVILCIDHHIR